MLKFNRLLRGYLDAQGHNDAWLARKTGLSKTTISRMVQNRDYRGRCYYPTVKSVIAVCLALKITEEQRWELFHLVFPEWEIYREAMTGGYSVALTNEMLEEAHLPTLTD
jgi:hypothetical protein